MLPFASKHCGRAVLRRDNERLGLINDAALELFDRVDQSGGCGVKLRVRIHDASVSLDGRQFKRLKAENEKA